jgi:hypothetical protein
MKKPIKVKGKNKTRRKSKLGLIFDKIKKASKQTQMEI